MWELLRDPMWQAIGAGVGLVAIVTSISLAVAVYVLQRRRKELGYRVLSQTKVVSVEAEVEEEIVILFWGQVVTDVYLVLVELVNSGNQSIVEADYERRLSVDLGNGARVLSAEQVESKPEGIAVSWSISGSREKVQIDPVLLNGGDSVSLKILVSGFGGTVGVEGRIVGVKKIRALGEEPGTAKTTLAIGVAFLVYVLPMFVALARGGIALFEGWLPGVVFWGGAMVFTITLWIRFWIPLLDRYVPPQRGR